MPTLNNQQSKLMDIFRVCAMEAQTSVEDIKNEMSIIAATFKSRHQKVSLCALIYVHRKLTI